MTSICPQCGKAVYFGERQQAEGKDWHGACLMKHVKDMKEKAKQSNPFDSYPGKAPQPVAHTSSTFPTRATTTSSGSSGQARFCSSCGTPRNSPSAAFCSSCGTRF